LSIRKPLVIVNFKTYLEGTGKNALTLSSISEKISAQSGIYIAVATQFTDISTIVGRVDIPVFAQHVDYPLAVTPATFYLSP
jgi:triosephosphate isomerase